MESGFESENSDDDELKMIKINENNKINKNDLIRNYSRNISDSLNKIEFLFLKLKKKNYFNLNKIELNNLIFELNNILNLLLNLQNNNLNNLENNKLIELELKIQRELNLIKLLNENSIENSIENKINNSSSIKSNNLNNNNLNNNLFSIPPGIKGIFKWTILRSLTLSLKPILKVYGSTTCLTVSKLIIFGTEKGCLIVYNLNQEFISFLGNLNDYNLIGKVTCIDSTIDSLYVVTGHERGHVCIWDLNLKKLLKRIDTISDNTQDPNTEKTTDGHRYGIPIVSVSVISSDTVYSADLQGTAFYHSLQNFLLFTSIFFKYFYSLDIKSIRIHGRQSSKPNIISTTILSFHALVKPLYRHPIDSYSLVALCSPFKVAILSMHPTPQIQYRQTWPSLQTVDIVVDSQVGFAECKWFRPRNFTESNDGNDPNEWNGNDPRLAFSHGNWLNVLDVGVIIDKSEGKKRLKFAFCGRVQVEDVIVSIEWINSKVS